MATGTVSSYFVKSKSDLSVRTPCICTFLLEDLIDIIAAHVVGATHEFSKSDSSILQAMVFAMLR